MINVKDTEDRVLNALKEKFYNIPTFTSKKMCQYLKIPNSEGSECRMIAIILTNFSSRDILKRDINVKPMKYRVNKEVFDKYIEFHNTLKEYRKSFNKRI